MRSQTQKKRTPRRSAKPTNIIPFPVSEQMRNVPLKPAQAALAERGRLEWRSVTGNILEPIGIFPGDSIIIQTEFSERDLKPNTVCIAFDEDGQTIARYLSYSRGSFILRPISGRGADVRLPVDTDRVEGIITMLQLKGAKCIRFRPPSNV
jgi:hypothetical protein